ncbi:MAG: hypothetical protein M3067_11115 [Chloroflexota bacterium]|nr:hypothetical protein [Chloroflexota bacterium]
MGEERSIDRRTFVRAAGIDALRAAVAVVDASRALQAAGIRAALGIDEEAIATFESAAEPVAPFEARSAATSDRIAADGAELAHMLRGHLVGDGPVLGPIAVHALAGTAAELVEQDAVARTNALRATAAILTAIRPASAALELSVRRAEAVWAPLADTDAPTIAQSLTALAESMTAELARNIDELASRLAGYVVGAVRGERGVLVYGPFGAASTGSPSIARQFAAALRAAGADPVHWVPEGGPAGDGLRTASDLADAGMPNRLIADASVAALLVAGRIGVVVVAPHRVTGGGSVVAPLGTYQTAVMAALHGVPYVVAATSMTLPAESVGEPATPGSWAPAEPANRLDARWLERVRGVAPPVDEIPPELVSQVVSDDRPSRPSGP